MTDYDTEIVLTSVLKLTTKNGEVMTKLDLLFTDPKITGANEKFVGCTPVTMWYGGWDVFDVVTKNNLILKGCQGHFIMRKDFKDPTKFVTKLEKVIYKDNAITLLQSNK